MTKGQSIRYTVGPLGLTETVEGTRYAEETAQVGDHGVYVQPAPWVRESGWHVTQTGPFYAVVHESMFEVVA